MRRLKLDVPYPNIRALREDRDYNQVDIAEVLNIAQNTYSQYETGKIEWTASTLIKLADFYNVSIDYLLGRTQDLSLTWSDTGGSLFFLPIVRAPPHGRNRAERRRFYGRKCAPRLSAPQSRNAAQADSATPISAAEVTISR